MKQKILFVLPNLIGGGAEKFTIRLANALAEKGYNISLLLLNNKSEDYLEEISNKIPIFRLNKKRKIRAILPLASFFKKQKPDIIFSTMMTSNILCLLSKIISGINANIYLRSTTSYSRFVECKNFISKLVARFIFPFASGIISPSQDVHQDNIKLGIKNKNMTVIYNFVDKLELQKLAAMPIDLPEKFANPLMLAAGRLALKKNHSYLIRGFKEFCQHYPYPDAKLIILGKGRQKENLEKLIKELKLEDKVFLMGFKKNPYSYFAKADLFVHTSYVEGLANVLLAALALGRNIVTTNCPGTEEALENGKYGRIIPITNDPKILAHAMNEVLQKPIDKKILVNSLKKFEVETIVQQYIKFMGLDK